MIDTVFIELTNYCNCKCKSCPQSIGLSRSKGYMDFDLFKMVVDQAWTISSTINFSFFGEPTLHPEFLRCLEYLRRRPTGKSFVIFSNFLSVTQDMMDALIDTNPSRVHLSINAATSQTYDTIRSGQSCNDLSGVVYTTNRFEILCNKVRHWFATPRHPKTRHEFTVASYSVDELGMFVQKWLPFLGNDDEILTKGVLSYGGTMLDESFLTSSPCGMWNKGNYLVVAYDGDVSPCFLDYDMKLTIGSILLDSLQHIHTGQNRKSIRKQSLARSIEPCSTCIDASHGIKTRVYRKGSSWNDAHLRDWK